MERDAPETVWVGAVMVRVIAMDVVFGTAGSVDDESAELTGDKGREADLSL